MNSIARSLVALSDDRKGKFGEAICENVMKSSRVYYIPLCRIADGGAPVAVAGDDKKILPDFDIVGGVVSAYLDAKCKSQSIRYRKTGQVRHGINKNNYESYKSMGVLQNKQCGLFIVELLDSERNWSGTLLCESFLSLGEPKAGFNEPQPKVYWPRDRFSNLGSFAAEELLGIAKGELPVVASGLLQTSFAAPPRRCPEYVHNDPANWRDEPARDGRGMIRTVCKQCGVFIGKRPGNIENATTI